MFWVVVSITSCLLSGVVLWFVRHSRGPRLSHDVQSSLNYDRDQIGRLDRMLGRSSQGGLAVTRELRRLAWQLDAYCTHGSRSRLLADRVRQTHILFKQESYPILLDVLRTADSVGFRSELLRRIEPVLMQLVNIVDDVVRNDMDPAAIVVVRPDVQLAYHRIETDLLELQRTVEVYFTTNLSRMIERQLLLREEEFARLNVQVVFDEVLSGDELFCRVFPRDLRAVIDNVLDNIMNAATDRNQRQLDISVETNPDLIVCRISYSWFRLQNAPGLVDRSGAGTLYPFDEQNLAPSRKLVQQFGGELWAEPAGDGVGTTIVLRLQRIRRMKVKEEQA